MMGKKVHVLGLAVLLAAITLTCACSQVSDREGNDGSPSLPPDGGEGAVTSDAFGASTSFDGADAQDVPSPSPSDGAPDEASMSQSDAARSDASPDAALEATPEAGADVPSDARADATIPSLDGGTPVFADGGNAQPAGPDGSLPGCGTWLSASPTHAGNRGTVQLTAAGRHAGLGAALDWNTTGGSGTGQFTNATATSATFTCFTPGPVVVTGTDPAGTPCIGTGYDQASVVIQCDGFTGRWAAVSVGSLGACGVTVDGAAWCWSDATLNFGLGNGTTTSSTFPASVSGLTSGARSVSVGNEFACALTTGGAVECWGGFPALSAVGGSRPGAVTGLPGGVTAISTGGQSACALTASQGVLCWGDDSVGEARRWNDEQDRRPGRGQWIERQHRRRLDGRRRRMRFVDNRCGAVLGRRLLG